MDNSQATKNNVPPEAHGNKRFSWAGITRKKTYSYNDSRVKYLREQCRIIFGPDALKSARKYTDQDGNKITTVELNIKFIEGL